MNKLIKGIAVFSLFITAVPSQATLITNGDFANSCNLTGWQQHSLTGSNDYFNIEGQSPDCTANISVSDSSWNNTLYQNLDLSSLDGDSLFLSMDLSVSSNDAFIDDYISISLFNENSFDLINIFGEYAFDLDGEDFQLDFTFDNYSISDSWALEFNLVDEIDDSFFADDTFVSTLSIKNISLTDTPKTVVSIPEPNGLALFSLSLIAMFACRKKA